MYYDDWIHTVNSSYIKTLDAREMAVSVSNHLYKEHYFSRRDEYNGAVVNEFSNNILHAALHNIEYVPVLPASDIQVAAVNEFDKSTSLQ